MFGSGIEHRLEEGRTIHILPITPCVHVSLYCVAEASSGVCCEIFAPVGCLAGLCHSFVTLEMRYANLLYGGQGEGSVGWRACDGHARV